MGVGGKGGGPSPGAGFGPNSGGGGGNGRLGSRGIWDAVDPAGSSNSNGGFYNAATPNQTNAFGVNSSWSQDPNGQFRQNQSFGGGLGQAVHGMQDQAAGAWSTPLDNGEHARDAAQHALYSRETSNLDPQWGQQEQQFNSQMAAQGLQPGSQAYDAARGNFDRARTNAYQQASYGSIIGGGQEAQRQQQMDLTSRMAPIQGMMGANSLTGQSQNPLLAAAIAQYQGELQKYGINQQGKNSAMGGISNLGGSAAGMYALGASDERLKTDVNRLSDEMLPGVPIATFRYKDDPERHLYSGVIAQDVEAAGYGHLVKDVNGIKMVHGSLAPIRVDE